MPYFISGVTADHKSLIARTPEEFRTKNGVDVFTRHRVKSIDPENKSVKVVDLDGADEFSREYTKLVIATGASPFVPPIQGTDLEGVFVLRKLSDAISIKDFIKKRKPRRAAVIGAGPVGMEMCESFRALGLEVKVVEMADRVMPLVDSEIAGKVQEHLELHGVECHLGQKVEALDGSGSIERVHTSGGEFAADIVLLGIGIRPNTDIAVEAGVELGAKGAIRVDPYLRTNLPDVYCAGDCATTTQYLSGRETWIPLGSTARKQGRLAAENMFGANVAFPGVQGTSVVKCFNLTVGRTGLDKAEAEEAGFDPVTISMDAESLHSYYPGGGLMTLKLTADRASGRLLGAQLAGEVSSNADKRLDIFAVAVAAGLTAGDLQYLDLAYAPPYSPSMDAPIVAGNLMTSKIEGTICTCTDEGLE
jgi:NADPH-dependent 2,4-dienoyl-CoA reductase/sulfur reductase-like enzyme